MNIVCNHIENICLNISSVECKFNYLMHNDLSFKLKFQDSGLDNIETVYTEPIKPKYNQKENLTSYSYFDDKNKFFVFENLLFISLNELRSSNLSLILYDTKLEIDEEDKAKDINVESGLISPTKNKSNVQINKNMKMKKKYNQIGYSYINFYKILSQNDNIILKTASKVFQTFSLLYTGTLSREKVTPNNQIQSNTEQQNGNMFVTQGNLEDNQSSLPKRDTLMSKEIKFQVFDDISKSFSEKIYHKGAEIGKVRIWLIIVRRNNLYQKYPSN